MKTAVEFLESQYHFNKQLSARDFKEAKKTEENQLQEHWEECERGMKESIFWNNKTKRSRAMKLNNLIKHPIYQSLIHALAGFSLGIIFGHIILLLTR